MPYDKDYLDRIRSAFKVSEVVGRKFKLRKQGAELVAVEDSSISVNDKKGIWHDFGSAKEGGDIFAFLQIHEGYSFTEAVDELARRAGISEPAARPHVAARRTNGHADEPSQSADQPRGRKEIVARYPYTDAHGALIYEVVRLQRKLPDGTFELGKHRKPWKSFGQRRKSPDGDGAWIWGLDFVDRDTSVPHEFMRKGPGADWLRFDEANFEQWHFTERRTFAGVGNIEHWLYNAGEVADELREDASDQRTIFLPEGEGKVEILKEWELLATTNSGGSQHFGERLAGFFARAADLVILEDNDQAGRERTAAIAPLLRKAGARVRVLNFLSVWGRCPVRGDIKDWRDQGGGDRSKLLEIVDKLPEWTPEPYRSKFGAVHWGDQYKKTIRTYDWAIKGLIPFGKSVLIYGESQCGKSFETLDMNMAIARGVPFAGRKCKQLGVVYCAAEKGEGFVNRMNAYEKYNEIGIGALPFVVLTKSLDLWSQEQTTDILIAEILALSAGWEVPLGVVTLDTYQAASPGASIIKDEDVTTMYRRAKRIMDATGAGVWFVHHKNAHGSIRGSLVLWNSIETTIDIAARETDERHSVEIKDEDRRVIRRATVRKQSEGVQGVTWDFVIRQVVLGHDAEGDAITSCVVTPPNLAPAEAAAASEKKEGQRPDGFVLSQINATIFRAMLKAIEEEGIVPPPSMKLPASVSRVVSWEQLRRYYKKVTPNEELGKDPADQSNNFKSRVARFRRTMMNYNVVAMDEIELVPGDPLVSVIWPTGRRVVGPGLGGGWPTRAKKSNDDDTKELIDQVTGLPMEVF